MKNFYITRKWAGKGILGQNFNLIGQETTLADCLIFESEIKML